MVYNKYHKLLYVLSYRYLMNTEMAQDAVQHVFTRLWEFRSELRVGVSLKNYLFTMTKNHILNIIRNENNALAKNYEMAQAEPDIEDNLIENLEKKELMSLFYKALAQLPPQKRDICLMKVRDELTNQEIADKLKLSINTIKTHYSDALKLLRDAKEIKPGYEEMYVNHEIPSDEMLIRIRRCIRRKHIRRFLFRAAAVLIPFMALVGLYLQVDSRVDLFGTSDYEEIYVPKGERIQMMFQDGTRVYINSDSRLKYPKTFALSSREVYLEGEAYFVVAKNKKCPFIVNLNGPSIHVLGTSFDVQAYPENKDITVCLDEGHINLTLPSEKKYPLQPGEKLIYNKESNQCIISGNTNAQHSSSWKQNVISFKDAPLAEVIKVLHRWYNIDFKVEDEAAWNIRYTLISNNTLLEKVLHDLEKIAPVRFEYDENRKEVRVTMKGSDS